MKRYVARFIILIALMLVFVYCYSNPVMAITVHYYTDKAAILMYHHFDENETSETISAQHFQQQLIYLQRMGYNFISLEQLTAFLENKGDIPANAVVLTFDDGYASTYENAYPFLKEKKVPATFLLIAKRIGARTGEIPKLTWQEITEMQTNGFDFQSHSYDSHQYISNSIGLEEEALTNRQYLQNNKRYENIDEYTSRIFKDLSTARTTLEKSLHKDVDVLSPPYGVQNTLVESIAVKAGYKYLLTTDPGIVDRMSKPTALKRINAGQAGIKGEDLHKLIIEYAASNNKRPSIIF